MKAIECTKYGSPEVLQLTEVEKPVPKNNEVLIKMHATAVTASDCIVRGFKLNRWSPMGLMMGMALGFRKPRKSTLGMIVSGEVEETGLRVSRFRKGDRVYGWTLSGSIVFGAYAQFICLPEKAVICPIPSQMNYEEAAAVPYGGLIALHYLRKGKIESRENVLIYGASGAIGTAAVQLVRYFGVKVTGVCSTKNLDLVRSLGADHVVDYTQQKSSDLKQEYDLILDAVGTRKDSDFKRACKDLLSTDGKYISIDDGSPKADLPDLEFLSEVAASGKFKPVIDSIRPLEEMVEAHRYVDKGHKKGNVIITINS